MFGRKGREAIAALTEQVEALKSLQVAGFGQLPAGSSTVSLIDRAEAMQSRDVTQSVFTPGVPFLPIGIDPRETNQPSAAPRRSEYPVSVNLQLNGVRHVPFSVLRDTADKVDVVRQCIEVRKAHITSLDWDFSLSRKAIGRVMAENKLTSPAEASQLARRLYEPEMTRMRDWWEQPDKQNGQDFAAWLSSLMEDQLVIDATTIWPRRNYGAEVTGFELIDGATIKPLLDYRGNTPAPPYPAYQQVLYGFSRGEWVASLDGVEDQYAAGQLVYRPRHRRTWSPYGQSAVETSLSAADLYLKRTGWIRSEFDDGTVPDQWMETDLNAGPGGMSPQQLLEFEGVFNASLSGNTPQRHRIHLLPRGMTPKAMSGFAERYNPALDDYLIKLLCMCFSVMPTEIGFSPTAGLGGKGHQEGEANSAYRKDIRPSVQWVSSLITAMSREFLGCPSEVEMRFVGYENEDQMDAEQVSDLRVKSGRGTINEERSRHGLPLFEFQEADTPYIQTAAGAVFLPGALAQQAAASAAGTANAGLPGGEVVSGETSAEPLAPTDDGMIEVAVDTTGDGTPDGFIQVRQHIRRLPNTPAVEEAVKFLTFLDKRSKGVGGVWRPFAFTHWNKSDATVLNALGRRGEVAAIREFVESIHGSPEPLTD
jgi:hypothetical protein